MNVKQLIAALSQFDPEEEVYGALGRRLPEPGTLCLEVQ